MKKHIPNIITSINVFFGTLAVIAALQDDLTTVLWCITISLVADFFDGFAARLLGVSGRMGRELDSMADMVSFGVLPGVLTYRLMLTQNPPQIGYFTFAFFGLLITVFSAIRLAKFNIDTRQTQDFIGLNTPATTMFFIGVAVLNKYSEGVHDLLASQTWILYVLVLIFAYLLPSEFPMFSLKFKGLSFRKNVFRYLLVGGAILLVFLSKIFFLAGIILWYILLSVVKNSVHTKI